MRHPLSAHLVNNAADSCEYRCEYSSSVQLVGGGTFVQSCGPACQLIGCAWQCCRLAIVLQCQGIVVQLWRLLGFSRISMLSKVSGMGSHAAHAICVHVRVLYALMWV
jgi:hypothetical protein